MTKMKKIWKFVSPIVIALLLNISPIYANLETNSIGQSGDKEISVWIDGVEQSYDTPPMIVDNRTAVPMRSIFEALGAAVEWDEETKTAKAVKGDIKIEVKINSYFASKNGETMRLDTKPFIMDGRTMVPLRFVSESFGAAVEWDGSAQRVIITNASEKENNITTEEKENPTVNLLTYEEAAKIALEHSYDYKNQLAEIEKIEENRSDTADQLGWGYETDDASDVSLVKKLKSYDTSLEMAKKQLEITKESIAFQVKNQMDEVNKLLMEMDLMKLEIENAETNLRIARTKKDKGLISAFDLEKEKESYDKIIKEKEVLEKSIEAAYVKLNSLLGINDSEKYTLEDQVVYALLTEDNVDYLVTKIISENPSVWNQEKTIESAELDLTLYVYNSGGESYKNKEINLQQEKNNLGELKLSLEETIRTSYSQIQQLEKSYELLEMNLKSAERELKLLQAQYNAGVATDLQLDEATLAVAQTKYEIKNKIIEHEKAKTLLYKPHLK
ncbi:MAG: stalk domain-containing protein [Bacillota bacterium]